MAWGGICCNDTDSDTQPSFVETESPQVSRRSSPGLGPIHALCSGIGKGRFANNPPSKEAWKLIEGPVHSYAGGWQSYKGG